ncbi:hypothetical protein [Beggiatoa leptomitoformis]|uniref:Uncharacterized protein n=1 Tax=Beggiatoa leptomitoformis TaxID=288004 RepID=A0A650GE59_9GAMM|nr:hypothetical protein [Beggiatoa leptomitoformis]QGX03720.1 hypothetical protein AL038_19090 [Beggiatoa leptomitoformis]QGX04099.1 hypothetical protein BLE401_18665 [Beggiatoa leptomitoformis]
MNDTQDNLPNERVAAHEERPEYEPPMIKVFQQDELLKNVAVHGCSPFDE